MSLEAVIMIRVNDMDRQTTIVNAAVSFQLAPGKDEDQDALIEKALRDVPSADEWSTY